MYVCVPLRVFLNFGFVSSRSSFLCIVLFLQFVTSSIVSNCAIDFRERVISKMLYYVLNGMLISAYSLTHRRT